MKTIIQYSVTTKDEWRPTDGVFRLTIDAHGERPVVREKRLGEAWTETFSSDARAEALVLERLIAGEIEATFVDNGVSFIQLREPGILLEQR